MKRRRFPTALQSFAPPLRPRGTTFPDMSEDLAYMVRPIKRYSFRGSASAGRVVIAH